MLFPLERFTRSPVEKEQRKKEGGRGEKKAASPYKLIYMLRFNVTNCIACIRAAYAPSWNLSGRVHANTAPVILGINIPCCYY